MSPSAVYARLEEYVTWLKTPGSLVDKSLAVPYIGYTGSSSTRLYRYLLLSWPNRRRRGSFFLWSEYCPLWANMNYRRFRSNLYNLCICMFDERYKLIYAETHRKSIHLSWFGKFCSVFSYLFFYWEVAYCVAPINPPDSPIQFPGEKRWDSSTFTKSLGRQALTRRVSARRVLIWQASLYESYLVLMSLDSSRITVRAPCVVSIPLSRRVSTSIISQ